MYYISQSRVGRNSFFLSSPEYKVVERPNKHSLVSTTSRRSRMRGAIQICKYWLSASISFFTLGFKVVAKWDRKLLCSKFVFQSGTSGANHWATVHSLLLRLLHLSTRLKQRRNLHRFKYIMLLSENRQAYWSIASTSLSIESPTILLVRSNILLYRTSNVFMQRA